MQNPEIQPALDAIGFVPDASGTRDFDLTEKGFTGRLWPNPAMGVQPLSLELILGRSQVLSAALWSVDGSLQRNLIDKKVFTTGTYHESFDPSGLPHGVYFLSVKNDQNQMISQKIILQ